MERISLPDPLLDDGVVEVAVLVDDELSLAGVLGHLWLVGTHEELALEQLDADDGEHELEEEGDQDDVADGFDGHDDALDHVFEAFSSVDGT